MGQVVVVHSGWIVNNYNNDDDNDNDNDNNDNYSSIIHNSQ